MAATTHHDDRMPFGSVEGASAGHVTQACIPRSVFPTGEQYKLHHHNLRNDDEIKQLVSEAYHVPKRFPSIFQVWWLELLSCLIVIGMLFAVVGTLSPHQGKPLPQWPYNLSINTVISIYFIVIKAAMLLVLSEGLGQLKWNWFEQARPLNQLNQYDSASRGPWGCLVLLPTLRGR